MRLVTTSVVSQLTGLSTEMLREWTSRRALIPADLPPKVKGSPAKFSWRTVLTLRIAVSLRQQFNLELQAHKASFRQLRRDLETKSFVTLWGQSLALTPEGVWSILEPDSPSLIGDCLLLRLDPHLTVLQEGFALTYGASVRRQLDLFTLSGVREKALRDETSRRIDTDRRLSA